MGRYSDEYYPRALGDYLHQNDIPCLLIESGAHPHDPMRDQARKLNFLCLLKAFELIATGNWRQGSAKDYQAIPENKILFYDLIIRQCSIQYGQQSCTVDLGLQIVEKAPVDSNQLARQYYIKEIGDLSFRHALHEESGGKLTLNKELQSGQLAHFKVIRNQLPNLVFEMGKWEMENAHG
ncbi:MAG: hypothetical protein U5L96_21970 [Owenweeksia sp.]|nr:hypothetical protein [Owenweeksia sp.]